MGYQERIDVAVRPLYEETASLLHRISDMIVIIGTLDDRLTQLENMLAAQRPSTTTTTGTGRK